MKAKLLIDGKELEVEITDEELKKLETKPVKKTGYERATKEDSTYYFDNGGGYVGDSYDPYPEIPGNNAYLAGNYYTSKIVAENNVRADKLMRQLRRFAVEHRENKLEWRPCNFKYLIFYKPTSGELTCFVQDVYKVFGVIYFDTQEIAELAIETFRDELIWYFTEYEDSL